MFKVKDGIRIADTTFVDGSRNVVAGTADVTLVNVKGSDSSTILTSINCTPTTPVNQLILANDLADVRIGNLRQNVKLVASNQVVGLLSTGGLSITGGISATGDLTVSGNLTVSGSTTVVNTTNLNINDPIIQLASGNTAGTTPFIGIQAQRGTAGNDAFIVWDEASDIWRAATSSTDGSESSFVDAAFRAGTTYTGGNVYVNDGLSIGAAVRVGGASHTYIFNNFTTAYLPATNWGGTAMGWNLSQGGGETNFVNSYGGGNIGGFRFSTWQGTTLANLVTLKSSGNFGIGVDNPTYKLEVNNGGVNGSKLFKFGGPGLVSLFGYSDAAGAGITNTDPFQSGA